jgi:hypothetical protein
MRTMSIPLAWAKKPNGELEARRGRSHYVISRRSDGQWLMSIFSMFTDEPGQIEEKLGHYLPSTLDEAKALAQGLADQHP